MKQPLPRYKMDSVISADGTPIGYRQSGRGPGLILVHGGMKSSQDFMKLAETLAEDFTTYLPDRRGRGMSGGYGAHFGITREVEDLQALLARTGARNLFGLSVGALVVLRTALATAAVEKAALYLRAATLHRRIRPNGWLARYER